MIKPKSGHNRYCGPGALSIIMHIDTALAAQLLREVSGKRSITGTNEVYMRRALEKKGYRCQHVPVPDKITLAAWLRANPVTKRGTNVYLISVAHHFVVVQGKRGGCNQTGGPGPLKDIKKRRGIVSSVILVSGPTVELKQRLAKDRQLRPFKTIDNALAALEQAKKDEAAAHQRVIDLTKRVQLTRVAVAAQAKRSEQSKRAKLRRQAREAGIRIERESSAGGGIWWVYGPQEVYGDDSELRDDPCDGSHGCHYPSEVDEAIEDYLKDLAKLKLEGVA